MPTKTVAKKTTTNKTAADPMQQMAEEVIALITSGTFDFVIDKFDDAVTVRLQKHADEKAKQDAKEKKTSTEAKEVPQPTRKPTGVTPEVGKTYTIDEKVKVHGGKKGKFLRYFKGEKSKSVIDIGAEKPIVVPTVALRRAAVAAGRKVAPAKKVAPVKKTATATSKTPAKKAPAKKTVAKK